MLKQSSLSKLIFATITAIGFGGSTVLADTTNLLQKFKATPSASPAQVLPTISNGKPYRQTLLVDCNVNSPVTGADSCILPFTKVPASHLLQVETVSCAVPTSGAFLFKNHVKLDAADIVAILPAPVSGILLAAGPFYFTAGDQPKLFTGNSSGGQSVCSIIGTLWQTP